jgi:hypothetical protein
MRILDESNLHFFPVFFFRLDIIKKVWKNVKKSLLLWSDKAKTMGRTI